FARLNRGHRRQVYLMLVQLFLSNCRACSKKHGRHLKKDMNNSVQSHVKKRLMVIVVAQIAIVNRQDSCTTLCLLFQ
ncbi:MAG: hypothetical protein KAX66_06775, partial [Propionivibrio sp.]|nr:hypothetical protein [Propionivibrio sp.]